MGRRNREGVLVGKHTLVTTETYDTQKFDIYVDEMGTFGAEVREGHGDWITAPTLPGLKQKLRETSRSDIKIQATLMTDASSWYEADEDDKKVKFRPVTVNGKHARTGAILYTREEDGQKGDVGNYGRSGLFVRLTKEEQQEYLRLRAEERAAKGAREKWEKAHHLDYEDAVKKLKGVEVTKG